jgi:DNA polymerase
MTKSSRAEKVPTYDIVNCGPRHRFVANGRLVHNSDKVNVQNLKSDGDLRRCIKSPEGHSLVIGDSAQIEVRVNAWLSGQADLLEEFRQGVDPYKSFAAHLYGVEIEDVAPEQRKVAKAAVLALGFGQGANGFQAYCAGYDTEMSPTLAAHTVSSYRRRYASIARHWRTSERELREQGYTQLPNGDRLTYPSLRIGDDGLEFQRHAIFRKAKSEGFTSLWHGKIVENKVQRVARDVVFEQTRRLWLEGWRIVLMVHDEAVLCVPDEQTDEAVAACEAAFAWTPEWIPGLPVAGEVKVSKEYLK